MRLPILRRSEIDYKFFIVYAWHTDQPTIPIALHEPKDSGFSDWVTHTIVYFLKQARAVIIFSLQEE